MLGFGPIASQPVGSSAVQTVQPYLVIAYGTSIGRSIVTGSGRSVYSASVNDKMIIELLPGMDINWIDDTLNIILY